MMSHQSGTLFHLAHPAALHSSQHPFGADNSDDMRSTSDTADYTESVSESHTTAAASYHCGHCLPGLSE